MLEVLLGRHGQVLAKVVRHRGPIARRTDRHILVHGRDLLVPADAQAAPLGQHDLELRPQHPRRSRGHRVPDTRVLRMLLRHDDFDDERMRRHQPRWGVDIADGITPRSDLGGELHLDLATALHVEVGFPALLDGVAANHANILVLLAFALAADFVGVLGAGWGDVAGVLVDAPIEFTDAPAGLGVSFLVDDAVHAELDEEGADGVDDGGVDDIDGEVGWGEDAHGLLVRGGLEGALDAQGVVEGDGVGEGGDSFGFESVVDVRQRAVGCCRQVAGKEVGEGQVMSAAGIGGGLGDEVPGLQTTDPVDAVRAVFVYGLLGDGVGFAFHVDGGQADFGVGDDDLELAREEGAG